LKHEDHEEREEEKQRESLFFAVFVFQFLL
jgi:hypothetical protein